MRLQCVLLPLLAHLALSGSLLDGATSQEEALRLLAGADRLPTEADVLQAVERAWWEASKQMLRSMREAGAAVGSMQEVRGAATRIRDQATDIINLMRVGSNAEETVVNAAFQWAQRPDFVYLNVKFASRIDGPVTCLNVDNENVTFTNDSLYFEGMGRQKPKTFRLNLTFNQEILPEASSWSFSSVGRMSITIAKKEHGTWPRLLKSKKKPKNMYSWYERQTALDEEVKKEKERKLAEDKKPEPAQKKASKSTATAPADGSPPPPKPSSSNADSGKQRASPSAPKKRGITKQQKDEV